LGVLAVALLAVITLAYLWWSAPEAVGLPQSVTVAGTGQRAFSGDGGPATGSGLVRPLALAIGPDGNMYIAEGNRVREIKKDGRIGTLAGTGTAGNGGDGGPAGKAQLNTPQGLAVDSAGDVYIADTLNNRVRRVDVEGTITTIAGTGEAGYAGDGKAGPAARLNLPTGLAIGFSDTLFIADTGNNVIRQLGLTVNRDNHDVLWADDVVAGDRALNRAGRRNDTSGKDHTQKKRPASHVGVGEVSQSFAP
jgi:hypothetical protein